MDTYEMLFAEARKAARPLAARVRKLEKQQAALQDRAVGAAEDRDRLSAALAKHRDEGGESLTRSSSAFSAWQGRLRNLTARHATATEALRLLKEELGPALVEDLTAARKELLQVLTGAYVAQRPVAEARMAAALDGVVAEHDGFLAAIKKLYRDNGCVFTPPEFDHGVVCEHPRIGRSGKRSLTAPAHFVTFTAPPAPAPVEAAPEATAPAPPDARDGTAEATEAAPESRQTVQDCAGRAREAEIESNTDSPQDAPEAARTLLRGSAAT